MVCVTVCGRGLVSDPVSVDASAEEFENILKALPTVPGGVSVSKEVSGKLRYAHVKNIKTSPQSQIKRAMVDGCCTPNEENYGSIGGCLSVSQSWIAGNKPVSLQHLSGVRTPGNGYDVLDFLRKLTPHALCTAVGLLYSTLGSNRDIWLFLRD